MSWWLALLVVLVLVLRREGASRCRRVGERGVVVDVARDVDLEARRSEPLADARGRVAETLDGYKLYSGVGPELAGLLKVVNTREIAEAWCDRERSKADEAAAPDDVVPWGLEARDGAAPPRPDDGAAPNAAAPPNDDAPPPPPEDDAPKKRTICL